MLAVSSKELFYSWIQWTGCRLEEAITLRRGFMCEVLISFIELETIYSAEHLHETQNKITEEINEKNKMNLLPHGLSSVLKCVVQQNLFLTGR